MNFKILSLAIALAALLTPAKAQNIVLNPGFEAGPAADSPPFSAPDWTPTAASTGSYFYVADLNPNTGANEVNFGGAGGELDYISQTLATVVGTTYDISFFLSVNNVEGEAGEQMPSNEFVGNIGGTVGSTANGTTMGGATNYITGGTTIADVVNSADTPYTEYTASFTAEDTSTNLNFGGLNGPNFDFLDDISVVAQSNVAVPEPSQYGLLVLTAIGLMVWRRVNAPVRVKARI
jgi:hypothetical protein